VTLLGRDLVVWLDGSAGSRSAPSWRAAVDECPHRLAAMSDGRLENGVLSCRYHGAVEKEGRRGNRRKKNFSALSLPLPLFLSL
jgi:phenylpropionate dioxygenase-like ring-hydroxylating dioxygenase large terminal subunit